MVFETFQRTDMVSEETVVPGGIQWHLEKLMAREQQQVSHAPIEKRPYKPPATADGSSRPGMQRRRVSSGLPSSRILRLVPANSEAPHSISDASKSVIQPVDIHILQSYTSVPYPESNLNQRASTSTAVKYTPRTPRIHEGGKEHPDGYKSNSEEQYQEKIPSDTNGIIRRVHTNTAPSSTPHEGSLVVPPLSWGSQKQGWVTDRGIHGDDDLLLPQRPFTTREHRSAERRAKSMVVYKDIVGARKVEDVPGPLEIAAASVPCFVDWEGIA
jgi:hypothetical protein